ncbi:MAG TPA: competence/damage-inducible protein A [Solirubrobacteraceae bacterium]|jgi:nicotinamide-nucleotide amidase|nr:competence/damage-inducible protein A [Solirubrobacteraceae bacterium]
MSARAGILITGTEVLTGRVRDRNGPWLSDRLRELGVDLAHLLIVGDRRQDMLSALRFLADEGMDLVITSGGLGPTADDLTAEVVGGFCERAMVLDEDLEERIAGILRSIATRFAHLDMEAIRASNRKQAIVPEGATVLDPVGTAPGLVVPPPPTGPGPTVVVLPGPPRELQPMWEAAVTTDALRQAIAGATEYRQRMLRLFGIPESEIAETLRAAEAQGVELAALEITTCLRRGEVEVVTRYEAPAQGTYDEFAQLVAHRHPDTLFSDDGRSVDEQVADLLTGDGTRPSRWIAVAESCTGGLLGARLTSLAGAGEYFRGGLVVYSNEAKAALAGVAPALIERHGAVSGPVADALADGARERLDADVGVGVTGLAGPGGGTPEKPVGLVWLSVSSRDGARLCRSVNLPGGRDDVRDRATTVALHLVRRLLLGHSDDAAPAPPAPAR